MSTRANHREAEAEAFRYVQEIGSDDDQPRVTRQDILHNRLEQAECAAIELRLEVPRASFEPRALLLSGGLHCDCTYL